MPFALRMEGNLFVVELTGTITPQDFVDIAREVLAFEKTRPVTPNRLTDLSGITHIAFSYDAIANVARQRLASPPANPIKSAVFAPGAAQFGMARMFQTLNQHHLVNIEIFRDRDSALTWLGAPPDPQI